MAFEKLNPKNMELLKCMESELKNNDMDITFRDVKKYNNSILVRFKYQNKIFSQRIIGSFDEIMVAKILPYMTTFTESYHKTNKQWPTINFNDLHFTMTHQIAGCNIFLNSDLEFITTIEGFDNNDKRIFSIKSSSLYIDLKQQEPFIQIVQDDFDLQKHRNEAELYDLLESLFKNIESLIK